MKDSNLRFLCKGAKDASLFKLMELKKKVKRKINVNSSQITKQVMISDKIQ